MPDPKVQPTKLASELQVGDWLGAVGDVDPAEIVTLYPFAADDARARVLVVYVPAGTRTPKSTNYYADEQVWVLTAEALAERQAAAERAQRIADIRRLADLLEGNPDVPMSDYPHWQINLHGADDVARVRTLAAKHGAGVVETAARTEVTLRVGDFEYCVIAWHKDGRPAEPEPGRELSAANETDKVLLPKVVDAAHAEALLEDNDRATVAVRADMREGERGRTANPNMARFLAEREDKRRGARHFLGLEESAKHYPVSACWVDEGTGLVSGGLVTDEVSA